MSKTLRAILFSIYCAVFLHSLKYLLLYRNEEIVEINYLLRSPGLLRKIMRDIKNSRKNLTGITKNFKEPTRFPTDLKFVLIWNNVYQHPSQLLTEGQKPFLNYNCTYFNCYLTSNKGLLVDFRYFDAMLFDEENYWDEQPSLRTPRQKYIFAASESPNFYPVCDSRYDNYYNFTWTYRLDSDIHRPLFTILDKDGSVVGPKINITWVTPMHPTSEEIKRRLKGKKKAVAWFVSNCVSRKTKTQELARYLNESLARNKLALDIYGWCGNMRCLRGRIEECLTVLRKSYYFYLAFENSVSEDFVSEKILYPLQNYAVPIVYGGADYSRFLPPGSYIDAGKINPDEVVSLIIKAIKNPNVYSEYFRWHNHYIYREVPRDSGLCNLCEFLNKPPSNFSVIREFRKWWNHNHDARCGNSSLVTPVRKW